MRTDLPASAAEMAGTERRKVARYILDKLPVRGDPADLVRSCVERGYPDSDIVWLANHHAGATWRWPIPHERWQRVMDLVADHRPRHDHIGKPCSSVGCPNAPGWMTG